MWFLTVWLAFVHLIPAHAVKIRNPEDTGAISGVIRSKAVVKELRFVHQRTMDDYKTKEIDSNCGAYRIEHLPDGTYDLLIRTTTAVYEGLHLDPVLAYYPPAPEQVLKELKPRILKLEAFYSHRWFLRAVGDEDETVILIRFARRGPLKRLPAGLMAHAIRSFHYRKMESGMWVMLPKTNREHFREAAPIDEVLQTEFYFSRDLRDIKIVDGEESAHNDFDIEKLTKTKIEPMPLR